MEKSNHYKYYILLHIGVLIVAASGICSKLAAEQPFFSVRFILYYSVVIMALFIYAVLWQQVLKHIGLTTAFLNKSVGIIWGMVFGVIVFDEVITGKMILGAILVLIGVSIVVTDHD